MQSVLHSVSYAGLWGQAALPLPAFIAKAAELGYGAAMIMAKRPHLSVLDADAAFMAAVKDALKRHNVSPAILACYNDALIKNTDGIPVAEMQLGYLESCARLAAELDCKLIRVFTGYSRDSGAYSADFNKVVDFLGEAARDAARHGVTLAVQNHHDVAAGSDLLEMLLDEINLPNVKAAYDAWAPFLQGEDLYAWGKRMAPRMVFTTVANYRRFPRYTYMPDLVNYRREEPDLVLASSMSDGDIDYPAFFKGLREGGYDGQVAYEMCSPLLGGPSMENLDAKARDFLAYMAALNK